MPLYGQMSVTVPREKIHTKSLWGSVPQDAGLGNDTWWVWQEGQESQRNSTVHSPFMHNMQTLPGLCLLKVRVVE